MTNRIDEIINKLHNAIGEAAFCLFVKDGEIVAKSLLEGEDLEFNVRFVGTDISDMTVKPLTKK
jgi:hypothetical protein|tara:strand:- start:127 stop:318 length:192 start_codon:yes stop_codon:yes gene_type:complete